MRPETWDVGHEMKEVCPAQGELLAYLDGEADPAMAQHLAACPDCAARLDRYRRTLLTLSSTLYRTHCPPPESLALYQLDLLAEREQLVAAQHVRQCSHCQRELAVLAKADEPALVALLAHWGSRVRTVLEGRWMPRPAFVAARGPEALRRYQVQGLDVLLRIQPADDQEERWNLLGRMVREDQSPALLPGTTVWLGCTSPLSDLTPGSPPTRRGETPPSLAGKGAGGLGGEEETSAVVLKGGIDDLGYFQFRDLAPGAYTLSFLWDDAAVLVREVTVP